MRGLESRREAGDSFDVVKENTKLTHDLKQAARSLVEELRKPRENTNRRNELAQRSPGWKVNRETALAQASLAIAGYNIGPSGIDGKLGSEIGKVIQRFQKAIGLNGSGQLDQRTKTALEIVTEQGLSFRQIEITGRKGLLDAVNQRLSHEQAQKTASRTESVPTKEYQKFWLKTGYFTNNWILDKMKQNVAVAALKAEIAAKGKIILPNETNPNKIAAIQYLGGILDTGEYGPDTYDKIQTIQTKYRIQGDPKVIDGRTFGAILARFNKGLIGQKSGDFLKRSGGLAYAPYDVAYGLVGGESVFKENRFNENEGLKLENLNGENKRGEIVKNGAYNSEYNSLEKGFGRLEGKNINVTQKGLDIITKHLSKFGEDVLNQAMLQRLETALKEGKTISGADASFYLHEATEATLMSKNISYKVAHAASLKKYQVSPYSVYASEVIQNNPELFNEKWFEFWGIRK